jgi:predicted  nucleic acid-binding Zn-ribbon protein
MTEETPDVEETLRAIYRLQQIDLELDELEAGSGDLPGEIEKLENDIAEIDTRVTEYEGALTQIRNDRNEGNLELQELRSRILELNEKLRNVRNNKEYDATTTEIESAEQRTQDISSSLAALDHNEAEALRELQTLSKSKEELQDVLDEKRETLTSIRESSSDELTEYKAQKKQAVKDVPEDLLKRYEFVRAKYPDAVVKVRKGACSGCFKAITPQTLVEMRRHEELFTCEHCNRILVDEELAETVAI